MLQHSTQHNILQIQFAHGLHAYLVMQAVDTTHPSLSVWRVQPLRKGVGGWQIFYTRMTGGWLCHSGMANIYLGRPDHKILLLRSLAGGHWDEGSVYVCVYFKPYWRTSQWLRLKTDWLLLGEIAPVRVVVRARTVCVHSSSQCVCTWGSAALSWTLLVTAGRDTAQ